MSKYNVIKSKKDEYILNYVIANAKVAAFDEAGDAEAAAAAAAAEAEAAAAAAAAAEAAKNEDDNKDDFTPEQQVKIDQLVADATKQKVDAAKRVMAELEAHKARTDLTDSQRKDLELRYDNIQKELMTKEQLFEQEKKKKDREYTESVETLTAERDTWKSKFEDSSIIRDLNDASSANDAFDGGTIAAILRPNTILIESQGEDGTPTGKYKTQVKFTDPEGKDGKPTELLLTASEAVKRMTELDSYQFLFKGRGTGGTGLNNGASGKKPDIEKLAGDTEAFRKARKEGRI